MATYTVNYWNLVTYDEATNTLTVVSPAIPWTATYDDEDGDSAFCPGEDLFVSGAYEKYLGHSDLGIFTYYDGLYGINTPADSYKEGDIIHVNTTEPFAVCFLAGTMIATPEGAVAIETLTAGDLVLTASGEARPVRWLARQTISTAFADPLRVMPILIRAGALGEGLPARDLYVSPDHALLIDDVLVQAGALVNGTGITRHTDMPQSFTYFHVELEGHALLLAEGVPAETFIDNVTRRRFDNYSEFEAQWGADDAAMPELDLPRVKSARQLPPAIRARIEARSTALGMAAAA